MYYSTFNPNQPSLVCVAESADGLRWQRPIVGTVEYSGSRDNNIVMSGIVHPSVMHEPDDPAAPFKLIWQKGGRYPRRHQPRRLPLDPLAPTPLLVAGWRCPEHPLSQGGRPIRAAAQAASRPPAIWRPPPSAITRSPDFRRFPPFDVTAQARPGRRPGGRVLWHDRLSLRRPLPGPALALQRHSRLH